MMDRKLFFRLALLLSVVLMSFSCGGNAEPEPESEPEIVLPGIVTRVSIYSPQLNKNLNTTVWLPNGYDQNKTYPFLYLLHGYGDDNNSWNQKGNASNIADNYLHDDGMPMVIIMPDGLTSFYVDKYETYMHETLMPEVENRFHCNGMRAVAGLSMGGYGTLYHALKYPEKFKYAYAMSPATEEVVTLPSYVPTLASLSKAHDPSEYPPVTMESGTEDYTVRIQYVRNMADILKSNGLKCDLIERSGGHDWSFWPVCLKKALVKIGETFKK